MESGQFAGVLEWGAGFILALQSLRSPFMDGFFLFCSFLADERFFLLLVPILWWTRGARAGALLCTLAIVTGYANVLLKEWVALPRPFVAGVAPAVTTASGFSFPSGHAQFGAAMWTAIYLLRPQVLLGFVAAAAIFLSGLSRSYLGVHYPSDVAAGWALGLATAMAWIPFAGRADGALDRFRAWFLGRARVASWSISLTPPVLLFWAMSAGEVVKVLGLALGLALALPLWIGETSEGEEDRGRIQLAGARLALAGAFGLGVLVLLYAGLGIAASSVQAVCAAPGDDCAAFTLASLGRFAAVGAWVAAYPALVRSSASPA